MTHLIFVLSVSSEYCIDCSELGLFGELPPEVVVTGKAYIIRESACSVP